MKTLFALGAMAVTFIPSATARAATVGTTTVYPRVTHSSKGVAQVYRLKAQSPGRVNRLNVYLDRASTVGSVEIGIYAGVVSRARALRASCEITSPRPNAWNRCWITTVPVRSHAYYWLALLHSSHSNGKLRYRERRRSRGPTTYRSKRRTLSSLPPTWKNGGRWRGRNRASIYADDAERREAPLGPRPSPPRHPAGDRDSVPAQSPSTPPPLPPLPPPPPPPPPPGGFPNPASTGTPAGWVPTTTRSSDLTVTEAGAVVQDVRFTNGASLVVKADNVTVRRVDFQGGTITNQYGSAPAGCGHNMLIEDTTFQQIPGQFQPSDFPVIGEGSYTARRIEIAGRGEGPRASDCGPVTVEDSFISIRGANPGTPSCDAVHSDGTQAYYGTGETLRNNTIMFETPCGTSAVWWPAGQGNTGTYVVDRLLVGGPIGFSFRDTIPGSVTGLKIQNNSWIYGPLETNCSVISPWEAKIVDIDANYQVTGIVRDQPCR